MCACQISIPFRFVDCITKGWCQRIQWSSHSAKGWHFYTQFNSFNWIAFLKYFGYMEISSKCDLGWEKIRFFNSFIKVKKDTFNISEWFSYLLIFSSRKRGKLLEIKIWNIHLKKSNRIVKLYLHFHNLNSIIIK